MIHWLLHLVGADNVSGTAYGFWSGFGSDLAEFAIIGGLVTLVRKHNCEVHGCWRLGRHKTAADHAVCRVHHPDDHLTHAAVLDAHEAASAAPKPDPAAQQNADLLQQVHGLAAETHKLVVDAQLRGTAPEQAPPPAVVRPARGRKT